MIESFKYDPSLSLPMLPSVNKIFPYASLIIPSILSITLFSLDVNSQYTVDDTSTKSCGVTYATPLSKLTMQWSLCLYSNEHLY